MPIYEYECQDCGYCFEYLHGFHEKQAIRCERCGSGKVTRLLSAGAFIFKGSGFYATDYKAKENGKAPDGPKVGQDKPACKECSASGSCPMPDAD